MKVSPPPDDADAKRDAVLRRMLATPKASKKPREDGEANSAAHKPPAAKRKPAKAGA